MSEEEYAIVANLARIASLIAILNAMTDLDVGMLPGYRDVLRHVYGWQAELRKKIVVTVQD